MFIATAEWHKSSNLEEMECKEENEAIWDTQPGQTGLCQTENLKFAKNQESLCLLVSRVRDGYMAVSNKLS